MASTLLTCTSSTKPASPSDGDTLFETDTNRIIVWDDGDSLWRTYNSDAVALNTTGVAELHYPTGLWASASATHYITVSPEIHFDASIMDGADAGNNPSDGVAVAAWGDRSGSSTDYDAAQASAGSQPAWTASGSGPTSSKATVTFTSDVLTLANEWSTTGSLTLITISKTSNANASAVACEDGGNYAATIWWKYDGNDKDYIGGTGQSDVSSPDTFNMHTVTRDGTDYEFFENGGGTPLLTGISNANAMKVGKLGQAGATLTWHAGEISEILVFESALSLANLNAIGDYFDAKYGLSTATFT